MSLTNEQKSLVERNMTLVNYVLNRKCGEIRKNEYEDLYQIGMVGLCKAAENFKPEYGYTFATFAIKCIVNEVYMTLRNPKLKRYSKCVSLDQNLFYTEENEGVPLWETLVSVEDTISGVGFQMLKETIRTRLNDRDRQIIEMRLDGVGQTEIGEHFGISQSYISRRITQIQKTIREEHGIGRFA